MLIAAYSGRALAASARRGGYAPLVADFFGDDDTLAAAHAHVRLCADLARGIDGDELEAALTELAAGGSPAGFVCGTGFEDRTDILARMAARWPLIGNGPERVARVKDPDAFAALCRRCHVPHPETSRVRPDDPSAWLVKRAGGAGGTHIRAVDGPAETANGTYYQRRVAGEAVAALLLADGRRSLVLGFSSQWASPTPREPYRYGGAVQPAAVAAATGAALADAAQRVCVALGLVGLNSVDFLVDGDGFHLLEVNPRPGATLDIFEPDDGSLFALHVAACGGTLPAVPPTCAAARANAVVYARDTIAAMPAFDWPDWAADRPAAGTRIPARSPFCTVTASAATAGEARRLVMTRAERILADVQARLS